MNEPSYGTKAPVAWRPAGLISWYGPDGKPLVLVTSWIALVGGSLPRLRTAWCGRFDSDSCYWPGGDFILLAVDISPRVAFAVGGPRLVVSLFLMVSL